MSDKSTKINTTKDIPAGDVLSSTLAGMEQWDMNVVNDVGGTNDFNGKSPLGGKK